LRHYGLQKFFPNKNCALVLTRPENTFSVLVREDPRSLMLTTLYLPNFRLALVQLASSNNPELATATAALEAWASM
jgi:hypothetical protein